MVIRDAIIEDALQIVFLMEQLGYPDNLEKIQERISVYIKSPNCYLIVAEKNSKIVGLLALVSYELFSREGKGFYIDVLVIDESMRNRDIGKKLMKQAESIALQKDGRVIELITADWREKTGTHKFYENLGFKDNKLLAFTHFCKEL